MSEINPPSSGPAGHARPTKFVGNFLDEFKSFALKGNMIDLAVAVIIGTAFGKVVDSLVKDIFMPVINAIIGLVFDSQSYLGWQWRGIMFGKFLGELVNFLIVALAVFLMIVKVIGYLQKLRRKPDVTPDAEKPVPEDIKLLTEIRDLLKRQP